MKLEEGEEDSRGRPSWLSEEDYLIARRHVLGARVAAHSVLRLFPKLHRTEIAQFRSPVAALDHILHLCALAVINRSRMGHPSQSYLRRVHDDRIVFRELVASVEDVAHVDAAAGVVDQYRAVAKLESVTGGSTCVTTSLPRYHANFTVSTLTDANVVRYAANVQVSHLPFAHFRLQGCLRDFVVVPEGGIGIELRIDALVNEDALLFHLQNET